MIEFDQYFLHVTVIVAENGYTDSGSNPNQGHVLFLANAL